MKPGSSKTAKYKIQKNKRKRYEMDAADGLLLSSWPEAGRPSKRLSHRPTHHTWRSQSKAADQRSNGERKVHSLLLKKIKFICDYERHLLFRFQVRVW